MAIRKRAAVKGLPEVCTAADIMRHLQIGRTTWWRWGQAGRLPARLGVSAGGHARYARADVVAWLAGRGVKENAGSTVV